MKICMRNNKYIDLKILEKILYHILFILAAKFIVTPKPQNPKTPKPINLFIILILKYIIYIIQVK